MKLCLSMLLAALLVGCSGSDNAEAQALQPASPASVPATDLVPVPGTSVRLSPPGGFVPADRFPGFMKESTGSSIMVSEIPGPYAEVTAGFSDKRQMQARGMTLLGSSSVKVDGQKAMLLEVEQPAYGTLFRKWMLAVERPGGTALIVASFPKTEAKQSEELRAAILAAAFGKPSDPADALTFVATPVAPFQLAKVIGQNMILSPGGRFPLKDEHAPFMVLGLSASEDLAISDQKAFAERRVSNTATVKDITVGQTSSITIGDLSGYATTANGLGEDAATPLTIYQVLLFDESGYCVIQGVTPTADKETYVPLFQQIAKTFKMKKSHNQNLERTRNTAPLK
jgi:hypothetical protein